MVQPIIQTDVVIGNTKLHQSIGSSLGNFEGINLKLGLLKKKKKIYNILYIIILIKYVL